MKFQFVTVCWAWYTKIMVRCQLNLSGRSESAGASERCLRGRQTWRCFCFANVIPPTQGYHWIHCLQDCGVETWKQTVLTKSFWFVQRCSQAVHFCFFCESQRCCWLCLASTSTHFLACLTRSGASPLHLMSWGLADLKLRVQTLCLWLHSRHSHPRLNLWHTTISLTRGDGRNWWSLLRPGSFFFWLHQQSTDIQHSFAMMCVVCVGRQAGKSLVL